MRNDGHSPQLADRERLNALIGGDEAAERRGIEMAVGMRHKSPGETEHPRIPRERSLGQLWQLTIISRRQVLPNLADLLLHKVVVVEQPFSGRHHAAPVFQLGGTRPVS